MKSEFKEKKSITDSLAEIRDSLRAFLEREAKPPEPPSVTVNPAQVTVQPKITIEPPAAATASAWVYEITARDKDGLIKTFTATPKQQER